MPRYEQVGLILRKRENTALLCRRDPLGWEVTYLNGELIGSADSIRGLRVLLDKDPDLAEVLVNRELMRAITHEFD
jgi:hypothetical protein